jgi:hypothetical protein
MAGRDPGGDATRNRGRLTSQAMPLRARRDCVPRSIDCTRGSRAVTNPKLQNERCRGLIGVCERESAPKRFQPVK